MLQTRDLLCVCVCVSERVFGIRMRGVRVIEFHSFGAAAYLADVKATSAVVRFVWVREADGNDDSSRCRQPVVVNGMVRGNGRPQISIESGCRVVG